MRENLESDHRPNFTMHILIQHRLEPKSAMFALIVK